MTTANGISPVLLAKEMNACASRAGNGIGKEPTALYRLFDAAGVLLYVGITRHIGTRMGQHAKAQPWWHKVARGEAEWYASRGEAVFEEDWAIFIENPKYNIDRPTAMFIPGPPCW